MLEQFYSSIGDLNAFPLLLPSLAGSVEIEFDSFSDYHHPPLSGTRHRVSIFGLPLVNDLVI